jgi:hypothetical protein
MAAVSAETEPPLRTAPEPLSLPSSTGGAAGPAAAESTRAPREAAPAEPAPEPADPGTMDSSKGSSEVPAAAMSAPLWLVTKDVDSGSTRWWAPARAAAEDCVAGAAPPLGARVSGSGCVAPAAEAAAAEVSIVPEVLEADEAEPATLPAEGEDEGGGLPAAAAESPPDGDFPASITVKGSEFTTQMGLRKEMETDLLRPAGRPTERRQRWCPCSSMRAQTTCNQQRG